MSMSIKQESESLATLYGHQLGPWEQAETELGTMETARCVHPNCNVWTSILKGTRSGWAHQSPMRCPCNWNGTEQR
jgi:hypothetical protein